MASQRGKDILLIGAYHKAQLAMGPGLSGDGIHRLVGIAYFQRQNFEAVPRINLLCRCQPWLAPIRVDLRRIGTLAGFFIVLLIVVSLFLR